jgi:formylglycine-generating enzyme
MKFISVSLILVQLFQVAGYSEEIKVKEAVQAPSAPEGMIYLSGGTYKRGSEGKQDNGKIYYEESPVHEVSVGAFFMDKTEVTNAQFKTFIDATGYKTMAERGLTKLDFPNAPEEALKAGASIFSPPNQKIDPNSGNPMGWWSFVAGAAWKHPQGPTSSIDDKLDHPVVCVNVDDALAYAKWAGKRLPTEAEWEFAARGGLKEKKYPWGDQRLPGKWMANCFQGSFPAINTNEDGFAFTAPVMSFPSNGYGLFDMSGNVWEICSDFYHPNYYSNFILNPVANPTGPSDPISDIENQQWQRDGILPEMQKGTHPLTFLRVIKGGSFLCHVDYCLRYRPAARHSHEPITPTNHIGFRCVKDLK